MKTTYGSNSHEVHEFDSMEELQNHLNSEEHEKGMMNHGKTHDHTIKVGGDTRIHEHDKIRSRTTGKLVEIGMGPNSGMVPANPFASLAQAGYLHAHPEKLGAKKLAEFDAATTGKKLPHKVK